MVALGQTPTAQLLDKRAVVADKTVARHLGVAPGTLVYRIERVRLADGVPTSFDETYLLLEIGEKIASNDLEAEPIFALLEGKYDMPLVGVPLSALIHISGERKQLVDSGDMAKAL